MLKRSWLILLVLLVGTVACSTTASQSAATAPTATPLPLEFFSSRDESLTLGIPESWAIYDSGSSIRIVMRDSSRESTDGVQILLRTPGSMIAAVSIDPSATIEGALDTYLNHVAAENPFEIPALQPVEIVINEVTGIQYAARSSVDNDARIAQIGVIQLEDGQFVGAMVLATPPTYAQHANTLNAILLSITPFDPATLVTCAFDDPNCYGAFAENDQVMTDAGFGAIGSAEGPILVAVVSDPACPHCVDYAPTFNALIADFVPTGQAQFIHIPVDWTGRDDSNFALKAAYCAGQQNAYWQFLEELYALFDAEGRTSFTQANLLRIGEEMGLDTEVLDTCLAETQSGRGIAEGLALATRVGVTGTPAVMFSYDEGATWELSRNRDYAAVAEVIAAANE